MSPTSTAKKAAAAAAAAAPDPEEHLPVDGRTMRHLHGLLTAHGIPTADIGRHDYLSAEVGRPITSASEMTRTETARLIAELEADDAPEVHTLTARSLRKLRAEFPAEAIGKLPRSTCKACSDSPRKRCDNHTWVTRCPECRGSHSSATMHIDYVGHADVTARLLEVDPSWTWAPMAQDATGFPVLDGNGGLWITLTVCGVTRPGYGENSGGRQRGGEAVKVVIGDALRNAAMRFGVALDLWAKGDREWSHAEKHGAEQMAPDQPPPPQDAPDTPYAGPSAGQSIARLTHLATGQGTDLAGITGKFREANGNMGVEGLHHVPAHVLATLVQQVEAYIAQQPQQPAAAS